jgi:two-component system chemotaxis sensor kinase CheA
MSINLADYHQMFFDEAAELLQNMERLLLDLDPVNPDPEDLNSIFRAAHSIKGGAGTFGFSDMAEVTHVLESLLDKVRNHTVELRAEMVDVFLEAADVLQGLLDAHRQGTVADPAPRHELMQALAMLQDGNPEPASSVADPGYDYLFDAPAQASETARPALDEPDPGYGFFEPLQDPAPAAAQEPDPGYGFFDPLPEPQQAPAAAEPPAVQVVPAPQAVAQPSTPVPPQTRRREQHERSENSIRVGVEKVDQLINLVGELVITHAMLAQTVSDLDPVLHERLLIGMSQLERNTRDLQESVMSIRMIPMSFVFSRFPRLVRDLAKSLGKEINLITEGEATELDKGLVEKIVDPLTHLVRNSLDHGIEKPEARRAAGKSTQGTLWLRASHSGGNIVIEVEDDGRGLDRSKLLAKAAERGIPASDTMSDADVWQLIFAPGFSTAEQVTDISGRGVGMDVVKRNIDDLGGRVELASQAGRGTRVTIRLPLTLAILDGMSLACAGQTFIIPLAAIRESLQPEAGDIRTVSGQGRVVHVRGEYLPLIALDSLFGLAREQPPTDPILVIVESGNERAALQVDGLLGQQQVVIKSLEQNYRKVEGIAGATIMGDGSVALIVDLAAVLRMARR